MSIHQEIQRQRKKWGFTQEQLAEKLFVSRQAVSQWESGESSPDIDKLLPLSEIFNINLDTLIKGPGNCSVVEKAANEDLSSIISFLCRAKKKTYAAKKGFEKKSCRPASHDLTYQEEDYSYLDSYFGGECFTGEEVLYIKNAPLWAMNYSGRVLSDHFLGDFLKESLSAVEEDIPYRGPALYSRGDYTYLFRVEGHFSWFQGQEEIFYGQEKVYQCHVHGGMIK